MYKYYRMYCHDIRLIFRVMSDKCAVWGSEFVGWIPFNTAWSVYVRDLQKLPAVHLMHINKIEELNKLEILTLCGAKAVKG